MRLLYGECTTSAKIMSPAEAVQRLQQHTKSRPVCGKFAKFTHYRFIIREEDKFKTLPSGATMNGATQYYDYKSCGKPGLLLRRKYRCFPCACLKGDLKSCPNASWSGKWEAEKHLFEHPKWSRNNFKKNHFFRPGTTVDPLLAPTVRRLRCPPAPPSDHWYGGLGVSLGDSEAWKPQKVAGCGWTRCPRNSVLSHVAQNTARAWFRACLTQTAHI